MNKVSLNGVEIYPFDSEQSLLSFVNDNKGILVAINAEKILHATDQTRGIINRNIGYCDGAGAQMALKQKGFETVLSFDDDELLNQFHLAVKAILDLQTVLKEKR